MGFLLPDENTDAMKPPFDISGDLDTPVSAFLKLQAFKPSFLLESVEGGERVARYSFIGFGDAMELRLDGGTLWCGGAKREAPATQAALLEALRAGLALAALATEAEAARGTVARALDHVQTSFPGVVLDERVSVSQVR